MSSISIETNGICADASSIISILTLSASYGTLLTIRAEGSDEVKAMNEILQIFDMKFYDE